MNSKKIGRKERFTTEKLTSIVDSFFDNKKVYGQVTATEIAEYAEKELGYEGIKYYHFNRNKDVKSLIDETNHINEFNTTSDKQTFIPFNPDKFLNTYKNDPKTTRIVLRQFANRYESLNLKALELETSKLQYEAKIESLKNENKKFKEQLRELRNTNKSLSENCRKLQNFKKFNDKGVMLNYLKDQGLVSSLDEENLRILLSNCNLINSDDSFTVSDGELEVQSNKYDNNYGKDYNTEVIILNEHDSSKNKDTVKNALNILNKQLKR